MWGNYEFSIWFLSKSGQLKIQIRTMASELGHYPLRGEL
jgi:hypothetical protein